MNINLGNLDTIIDYCRQGNPSEQSFNILVLGIGGGSDVISAYTIALSLFNRFEQLGLHSKIAYANTKRGAPDLKTSVPLTGTNSSICSLKNTEIVPVKKVILKKGEQAPKPGPVEIEESLPRDQFEFPSPLLFYLKDLYKKDPSDPSGKKFLKEKIDDYDKYFDSFRHFITDLNFDMIIGVDNGGDSLAKGEAVDPDDRDRQMLDLLKGIPSGKLIHMVVSPTIDGETPAATMINILKETPPNFYVTSDFLIDQYSVLAQNLASNKTPNLIIEGWRLYRENPNNTMVIDRAFLGKPPSTIPVFLVTLIAVYLYH